ncbi:MAG: tetratricopeptide repeat protein [Elusimicrobiota bacterium]
MKTKNLTVVGLFLLIGSYSFSSTLDDFYNAKKAFPKKAESILEKVIKDNPENVAAQAEMGYLLLSQGKKKKALESFKAAEKLEPNNENYSLQVLYIQDSLKNGKEVQKQYAKLKNSQNPDTLNKISKISLQSFSFFPKLLPTPYFGEIYFNPYYSSRFDLGVFTGFIRAGREWGQNGELETYLFVRANRDSKSKQIAGRAPIIFSDNVGIAGIGSRLHPFHQIPVSLFIEYGKVFETLNVTPDPKHSDFRFGATLFHPWGNKLRLNLTQPFTPSFVGHVYGDVGYYDRYKHNVIGYARLRAGARLFEKNFTTFDILGQLWYAADKNDDFFNNVLEYGPVFELVPDHRFNLTLRYMIMKGDYLRRSQTTVNPYGKDYTDHRWEAEFFWRF